MVSPVGITCGRGGDDAGRGTVRATRQPHVCFYPYDCPKARQGMTALIGRGRPGGASFTLDDAQREAVLGYCKIAAVSGAPLAIDDLVGLLAIDATEEELERSIASDEWLSSKVYVEAGLMALVAPGSDREAARKAIQEAERRRRRALSNIEAAKAFSGLFRRDTIFTAVAG